MAELNRYLLNEADNFGKIITVKDHYSILYSLYISLAVEEEKTQQ